MIIAISRTILLHRVLPPPQTSLHTWRRSHLLHHLHHRLHLLLHHRQQGRRLAGVRLLGAPSDKHFSTCSTHLRPNWPLLLPPLSSPRKTNRRNFRRRRKWEKCTPRWIQSGFSSTALSITVFLFPPGRSFAGFGLSITIGLIRPRCKSTTASDDEFMDYAHNSLRLVAVDTFYAYTCITRACLLYMYVFYAQCGPH